MHQNNYVHEQHAHCESGVIVNLLRHEGINLSEPMAFGIGAGIFFGHLPFLKVSGVPATTFRIWPGYIFKRVTKHLGIKTKTQSFKHPKAARAALDEQLALGRPVGMVSGIYYLSYMPEAFRFHFNAHNLVISAKDGDEYIVSDPILETTSRIHFSDLDKARFAKGFPAPKGKMYYITEVPEKIDLDQAIKDGIRRACFFMLSPPLPIFGKKAIYLLSRQIRQYDKKLTPRQQSLYLGNIIRMQEEIGTGGGGFRFLYAAFLQEAGTKLGSPALLEMSSRCTALGDQWRAFAYNAARIFKKRSKEQLSFTDLSRQLHKIADDEYQFFKDLKKLHKTL